MSTQSSITVIAGAAVVLCLLSSPSVGPTLFVNAQAQTNCNTLPEAPKNLRIVSELLGLTAVLSAQTPCWPDATNTGIAGKGLTTASLTAGSAGNTTSTGQLILRKIINGDICVVHSNVIIRESKINGQIRVGRNCSTSANVSVTGTLIEDTTINPNGALEGINDINGTNSIYQRNDICCSQNYLTIWTGTNVQILNNFGHDEKTDTGAPHFDGIEAYCWHNGLTIRGNAIYQTQSGGATAPLNVTPVDCTPSGQLLVESNLFRSANSAYVILIDNTQGGTTTNAVFNNNHLWRVSGGGYFAPEGGSNANYSGTGNVDHMSGVSVNVP